MRKMLHQSWLKLVIVTNRIMMSDLRKLASKCDLRKCGFTSRSEYIWNSLPNWVASSNTTNTFKIRLDRFWQNQEIIYHFKAQLEETESWSNVQS